MVAEDCKVATAYSQRHRPFHNFFQASIALGIGGFWNFLKFIGQFWCLTNFAVRPTP